MIISALVLLSVILTTSFVLVILESLNTGNKHLALNKTIGFVECRLHHSYLCGYVTGVESVTTNLNLVKYVPTLLFYLI